jgi:hypothetical protein
MACYLEKKGYIIIYPSYNDIKSNKALRINQQQPLPPRAKVKAPSTFEMLISAFLTSHFSAVSWLAKR